MKTRVTIWKALTFVLASLLVAGAIRAAGSGPTPNRIAKFIDGQGNLADSTIRENASGNIGIGGAPNEELRLFVNDGRTALRSSTDGSLGTLAVSQNGSGPIATFRNTDKDVRLTVDADGIDIDGRVAIAGQEVIDSSGVVVADVAGVQKHNPLRVAQLRWYEVNESESSVALTGNPSSMAFDGEHLWVTQNNSVAKVRANDGTVLGSFPVDSARGIAFDGLHVWVGSNTTASVTKIRTSDGSTVGTFTVDPFPTAVAFDGSSIWVACLGNDTVAKVRASDGALLGTFSVGSTPSSVAFDGESIWVSNISDSTVTKLRANDGALLGTFPVGASPAALAFDGENIWVANSGSGSLSKLRVSDGMLLDTVSVPSTPASVVFDGDSIWVAALVGRAVAKVRARDGEVLATTLFDGFPQDVVFDGSSVWVSGVGGGLRKL